VATALTFQQRASIGAKWNSVRPRVGAMG